MQRNSLRSLLFIVYLLFGLYLINIFVVFVSLPKFFTSLDKGIFLISGILLILGGINYLRVSRRYY
jgi:hypothetical protein